MCKFLIPLLWGAGGRWFESSRPDIKRLLKNQEPFFIFDLQFIIRDVAQSGSVRRSGRRGYLKQCSL
jgi:hypothetical protein